jgi:pimeloyl-ACP methyl ester carboxylesterase
MPTFVTEQGVIHYEVVGRGQPVILLHGWLGSWALWRDSINELSRDYRTYALDFFGFGESDDHGENYSVDNFIELVYQFMERLGIPQAPIVGHSMGGTVALGVAIRYPGRVSRVVVIGSPIDGQSLSWLLKLSGRRAIARLFWIFPPALRLFLYGYSFLMARDGRKLGPMITSDVSMITMGSFFQSIGTLRQTDLRAQVGQIQVPILGMYGKRDIIVRPDQGKVLVANAPNAREEWYPEAGHFIMLDEPQQFYASTRAFLGG